MNLQDDPEAVFRKAMPNTAPPPARFDLDLIVQDGYRARRRHRAALGGAATAGVAAVAAVLAFSAGVIPGTTDDADTVNPPAAGGVDDPAMAGYPWPGEGGFGDPAVADQLTEAGRDVFGDILVDTGLYEASDFASTMSDPSDEEIRNYADETGVSYEEAKTELTYEEDDGLLVFTGSTSPGNYGQVQLHSYEARAIVPMDEEHGDAARDILRLEAMLPGGWTAEPGPTSEQFFPQHLIDDADATFETVDLGDGRTLYTADRGCGIDAAVVYPNGSALRGSWDADCGDGSYPVDFAEFTDALLAMPEIDYDTTGLTAVEEVAEVPAGWLESDTAWEAWAADGAQETRNRVADVLAELAPGAVIDGAYAFPVSGPDIYIEPDAVTKHQYGMHGTLPYETTIDTTTGDVAFELGYTLPGGWLPGVNEPGARGPHLVTCEEKLDFTCAETEVDGRTAITQEMLVRHEPNPEQGNTQAWTEGIYEVTVFDPEGWAVNVWLQFQGEDFALSLDELTALVAALPAPEYDEELVPVVPED